ncbi:MAG: proprotein convertase P-domain-containing protein [Chloroflexi bacterium]|nr:proprotein convertase P-domain-containing protein [Chloroflexota bacterium]
MTPSTSARQLTFHWHRLLPALLACTLLIGLTGPTFRSEAAPAATTWHVAVTGDDNTCESAASACRNIGRAIDLAASGDTIIIGAGTFYENLDIFESLTLQGAGAGVTIIDGSSLDTAVVIAGAGENIVVTITGLTVQKGRSGSSGLGGGLLISGGTTHLSNMVIYDNIATSGGGGIYSLGTLNLTNVTLANNLGQGGQRGGGLYNLGIATLTGVTIANNSANLGGGIGNAGNLTVSGSTLSNNTANEGGGVYNAGPGARFVSSNNTYISNHTSTASGGAIYNAVIAIDTGSLITCSLASTGGGGIFNLATGQLTLNNTTLRNNQAAITHGGGLYNDGSATLTGVTIRGNTAINGIGGGLYSASTNGTLTMVDTLVSDNRAVSGGGIYAASISGTLTLINSQITNNQSDLFGGGLYGDITANLTSAIVSNNQAGLSGGGIYAVVNSRLTVTGLTLENNTASGSGGGFYNNAPTTASNLTIKNNRSSNGGGGGVYNDSNGRLTLANVSGLLNSAGQQGGGINNRGVLTLTQGALYSNTTTLQGGSGLYNAGAASAQLTNVTLSNNAVLSSTTGAILNEGGTLNILNGTISHNSWPALARNGGTLSLANTIIANSTGGVNCSGAITSLSHNLGSDASCGLTATGDISNTDPLLGVLQNNGGSTPTRSLLSSSPALDTGNNTGCPAIDQRGVSRPQGSTCDIGAYEVIGYSNNISQTIGSQMCVTSTTSITGPYVIGTVYVGANIAFEPRGNLRVNLYAPNNQVIHLLGDTGGSGQNLDVLWDDSSPFGPVGTENHNLNVPFYKYVRVPDASLTPLFGRRLAGDWRLEVCNVAATGSGTLNRWSLIVPSFGNPRVLLPLIRR